MLKARYNVQHIVTKRSEEDLTMDYYESAENIVISRKRALKELDNHGVIDYNEFYEDLGYKVEYKAQDVLAWLGY